MWRRVLPIVALVLLWAGPAHAVTCPSAISALSPTSCWPLQETSGTTITDTLGVNSGTISGGYTLNQGGGIACNGMTGLGCNITTPTQYTSPQPMSLYVDFSGTQGGLLQFGSTSVLAPTTTYYALYLDNHGKLTFGTDNYGTLTVLQSSQPYADGNEHKAVVTIGPTGMQMYVDGQKVASNGITLANYASGYWFLGGINTANWQLSPALSNFNGTLTTIAWWNGTQLTDAQGITATGGNPTAISNSYCTFTNQIASLNPATAMAFANKRLTFTTTSLQNRSSSSSSLPLGPSTEVCQTDASGNILAGCQVPQGAHVNLSVGNGPAIPLVIPLSTSCDLTAIMLSQTDPPEVVSAVAVAGPLFAGATVTNPPAGTIGTATITSPAAFTVSTGSPVTLNIGTNGNVQQVTMTASITITLSGWTSGANFLVDTAENGTGGWTPTFAVPGGDTLSWSGGGSQPTMPSTSANAHVVWQFTAVSSTALIGTLATAGTGTFPLSATASFNHYSGTNINDLNQAALTMSTPSCTATCSGTCATTYTYEVTAEGDNSTEGAKTSGVTCTNAASLSSTNYNTITWSVPTGAYGGVNVYGRTGGGGLLATCTGSSGNCTATSYKDDGSATPGASPPTYSKTGALVGNPSINVQNTSSSNPVLVVNAPSGQTGDLIDAAVNGTNKFTIDSSGNLTCSQATETSAVMSESGGPVLTPGLSSIYNSSSSHRIAVSNNGGVATSGTVITTGDGLDALAAAAGNYSMNSHKLTNLTTPTAGTDSASWAPPKAGIGSLPACAAGTEGATAVATDCNAACTAGGTCTTGGSTHCGLYCNGSAWKETGL